MAHEPFDDPIQFLSSTFSEAHTLSRSVSPLHSEPLPTTDETAIAFELLFRKFDIEIAAKRLTAIEMRSTLQARSGVYALNYKDDLVYLGSTDNLRGRLNEHARSVRDAAKIGNDEVFYRYATCGRHEAKAIEGRLIEHYAPIWNTSGFGSKGTNFKPSSWNTKYGRSCRLWSSSKIADADPYLSELVDKIDRH